MPIVKRLVKGSKLTHAELDGNFDFLNDNKINNSALNANYSVLVKDSGGNITKVVLPINSVLGRLATGEIVALSAENIKTIIDLATALALKADVSLLNGKKIVAQGTAVLVAGAVDVVIPDFVDTDMVQMTHQGGAGTAGFLKVSNKEAGEFTITSSNAADLGTIFYQVWRNI
jgi:hypothetical protein